LDPRNRLAAQKLDIVGGDPWRMIFVATDQNDSAQLGATLDVEDVIQVQAPSDEDAGSSLCGVSTVPVAGGAHRQAGLYEPG